MTYFPNTNEDTKYSEILISLSCIKYLGLSNGVNDLIFLIEKSAENHTVDWKQAYQEVYKFFQQSKKQRESPIEEEEEEEEEEELEGRGGGGGQ
jgi:hypothetical protein